MSILITCITKPQGHFDHTAIISLGWKNEATGDTGRISRTDLWQWLTDKKGTAHTKDAYGNKTEVQPRTNEYGTRYVQTVSDGKYSDRD